MRDGPRWGAGQFSGRCSGTYCRQPRARGPDAITSDRRVGLPHYPFGGGCRSGRGGIDRVGAQV